MMKLIFLIPFITLFFGCGNNQKQEGCAHPVRFSEIAKQMMDEHNAQDSLDYEGIYKGKFPTADGEGMEVTVELSENNYTQTVSYIGKENSTFTKTGKYTWNEAGDTITLNGANAPNQYFVGENKLIQLDMDGQMITGELADMYVLKKQYRK